MYFFTFGGNESSHFISFYLINKAHKLKACVSVLIGLCVCMCLWGEGGWWWLGVLSPHFSGSGKWLYYHTSLSWLLLHITDIRHSLHFCPRQLWACGDHVRNFSGALGFIGCVSYIPDKYTYLSKVSENTSGLCCFIPLFLANNITTTPRS